MKNNSLHTTNIFKNNDPEILKKAVTYKIEKLLSIKLQINLQKAGSDNVRSRDLLPFINRGQE